MVLFHGLCLTALLAAQGPFSVSSTRVLGRNLFPLECGVLLSPEPLTFSACCLLHPMAENLRSALAQGLDEPLGGLGALHTAAPEHGGYWPQKAGAGGCPLVSSPLLRPWALCEDLRLGLLADDWALHLLI